MSHPVSPAIFFMLRDRYPGLLMADVEGDNVYLLIEDMPGSSGLKVRADGTLEGEPKLGCDGALKGATAWHYIADPVFMAAMRHDESGGDPRDFIGFKLGLLVPPDQK